MVRDFQIPGESLVLVKSNVQTAIGNLTELGLSETAIQVSPMIIHKDITLDAWGGLIPADVQVMLGAVNITIGFIHFDPAVLDECLRLSFGSPVTLGRVARAGTRI